jgi:uncharacterized protein YecE (DUF72 family)
MIGTAGWSIPRAAASEFPGEGTHLVRYARVLACAEINSSFYRDHSVESYRKWAAQTPANFRFSVKLPQVITHEQHLRRARTPLREFLGQIRGLGRKLGPLLIQLPPSLEFDARTARTFFSSLREEFAGAVSCEPRHPTWFEPRADATLEFYRIGRVAADPTSIEAARIPGGWSGGSRHAPTAIAYYRLHGSPQKYWSRYEPERVRQWAQEMAVLARHRRVWCIFDNTASGAAIENSLELRGYLAPIRATSKGKITAA